MSERPGITVGVLSDTHGLLRPEAIAELDGVNHILHAGDIGSDRILEQLLEIAPLTAIRGNVDHAGACAALPPTEVVELQGCLFYLVHSVHDLDVDPVAGGISAVISGHSHRAEIKGRSGVLFLNPGSAGPMRFSLPATLAKIHLQHGTLRAEILIL